MMTVFVSSDPRDNTLGQEWLQKIKFNLRKCVVEIVISSPQSIKRPWINFEAGAGWIRNVSVIPLCHSGLDPNRLPAPLHALQAATATDEYGLKQLLRILSDKLESDIAPVDLNEFIGVVKAYEQTTKDNLKAAGQNAVSDEDTNELMPHEMATFMAVGQLDELDAPVSVSRVIQYLEDSYTAIAVKLALKILERKDFIIIADVHTFHEEYRGVRLSDPGWSWLIANRHKLRLEVEPPPDDPPLRRRRSPPPTDGDDIPF